MDKKLQTLIRMNLILYHLQAMGMMMNKTKMNEPIKYHSNKNWKIYLLNKQDKKQPNRRIKLKNFKSHLINLSMPTDNFFNQRLLGLISIIEQ